MGLETIAIGALAAGGSIYKADQSRKAANQAKDAQKELIANLKYEPIDIAKLKAEATQSSIDNARQSIALEKELSPDVAAIRSELPRQVSQELAMGGNLSPDVANQIARQSRTIGGGTGTFSGVGPITAALTGTTAQNLIDQRQAKAANMLAMNQLPTVGLDPGSVASLEAQQNAALNQFNLSKAGINSNMIDSQYQAQMANVGANAGVINSLGGILGGLNWGSMAGKLGSTAGNATGLLGTAAQSSSSPYNSWTYKAPQTIQSW